MTGFSPTEAATEGIRLTRFQARAVVIWGLAYFAFTIVLALLPSLTLGPHGQDLVAEFKQTPSDSDAFWPLAGRMWPFFAVGVPIFYLFQSILTCAVYRAVLKPEDSQTGYMRLGADELRMTGLTLIVSLIWAFGLAGIGLVAAVIATTAGMIAPPAVLGVLAWGQAFAYFGVGLWVWVRLSLAGAITFSEHRIQVWKSWDITRGRFWPLLGAYVLAFLLWLLLIILWFVIIFVAQQALHLAQQFSGLNLVQGSALWSDTLIFLFGLFGSAGLAIILTCFTVIWTAPFAEAYRELMLTP